MYWKWYIPQTHPARADPGCVESLKDLPHGNLPALVKMLRTSFSDEQLRVVFNRKSAGRFSSEFPSSRAPTSLHHLCNQESSPAAFKGFRCNELRFKGLQQLYNDQSK